LYNYLKENRNKILFLPLIFYWIILFIGTSLPSDNFSDIVDIGDKFKHFSAYLILAFLLSLNLHFQEKWEKLSKNFLFFTLVICFTYGAFDEIHQIFIPNRSAELLDWIADILGATSGGLLAYFFLKRIKIR